MSSSPPAAPIARRARPEEASQIAELLMESLGEKFRPALGRRSATLLARIVSSEIEDGDPYFVVADEEGVVGVAHVDLYGVDAEEVRVDLDVAALRRYGLGAGQVVEAIRRVAAGKFAMGPSVEERFPQPRRAKQARQTSRSNLLTNREQQILRMIGRGLSRSDIARELHRSSKTVDAHQQSIMKKLDIHDRVELVRYAIREGLVEP